MSFSWATLYLQFGSVPLVFETNHNFNIEQVGAVFAGESRSPNIRYLALIRIANSERIAMCVGVILITIISIWQDKLARRYKLFKDCPETRLYFVCVESILLPIGLFWFGWTSFPSVHWISPSMAVGCASMGIFSIYLATFNYLADTYHKFSSSAIAAQSCCAFAESPTFQLPLTNNRPKLAWWRVPSSHCCHVHKPRFPRSLKSPRCHCAFSSITLTR